MKRAFFSYLGIVGALFFIFKCERKKNFNLSTNSKDKAQAAAKSSQEMSSTLSQPLWLFHWTNNTTALQDPQGYLKKALEVENQTPMGTLDPVNAPYGPGLIFSDDPQLTRNQESFVIMVRVAGGHRVGLPQGGREYQLEKAQNSLKAPWGAFVYPAPGDNEGSIFLWRKGLDLIDTSKAVALDPTPNSPRPFSPRDTPPPGEPEPVIQVFADKWGLMQDMVARHPLYFSENGTPTDFAWVRGWFEDAIVGSQNNQAIYQRIYGSGALDQTSCAELLGGCLLLTREFMDRPHVANGSFQNLQGATQLLIALGGLPPAAQPTGLGQLEAQLASHWRSLNPQSLRLYRVLVEAMWPIVRQKRAVGLNTW